MDRRGFPIYVVTDFYTLDRATAEKVRADESQAYQALLKRVTRNNPRNESDT
jgi:hypothetical protein